MEKWFRLNRYNGRYISQHSIFSFLLENFPINTENLESVGAVVAEESPESDRRTDPDTHTHGHTLTCDINPVPNSIQFKF